MILIFGGVYQGKLAYALDRFGFAEVDTYHCREDNADVPSNKRLFYEIDKWILALVRADADVTQAVQQFISTNAEAVVICNDISCGIVPTDPVLRKWREAVGRAMSELSRNSSEVVRLYCGIPTRLR